MLGPARFDHIRNCARDAIVLWERDHRERRAKKAKVRGDQRERERLVRTLPERDESVAVLRELLAEKSGQAPSASGGWRKSQGKTVDYETLPLAALERLEQVRDATIGWVLRQIEKVEKTQARVGSDGEAAAMPVVAEVSRAQAHIDEPSTKDEESKIEDLENQITESTPPETNDT